MIIAHDALVMLEIMNQIIFVLSFRKYLLTMYKCTFSGTGDRIAFKHLDDAYLFVNTECMSDKCD